MLNVALFLMSFLLLSSCVSTYTALNTTEIGESKMKVRHSVGKPQKVGRYDGMDYWTYQFKWKSQEFTRNVFFDSGRVKKLGPLTNYPNYERKMIEADNLDEYEINASLYQKQKRKVEGLRGINSVSPANKNKKFCASRFGGEFASLCGNIIRDSKFSVQALHFCVDKPLGAHGKKLRCLETIMNKRFQTKALKFCAEKQVSTSHIQKIKCLKTISNKQFSSSGLNFCRKYAGNLADLKIKCLSNLGNRPI